MKLLLYMIFLLYSTLSVNIVFAQTEKIFDGQTSINNPFQLRDPFKEPKFKTATTRAKNKFSGILDNTPRIGFDFNLENIKIIGLLIGKNRRVILKVNGEKDVFTLSEGDTYGVNGPVIKAILAGGIILVEKITNIYGEDEFIETVVPISR